MPHHKSAAKRVGTNELRRQRNVAATTRMRNAIKAVRGATTRVAAEAALKDTISVLDRTASKGVMRRRIGALLLAMLAIAAPGGARPARAQAPEQSPAPPTSPVPAPFEVIPRGAAKHRSHHLAWITGLAGAGLVAVSFPLAAEADHRYARYLDETDVSRIDDRFAATARMDRLASGTLLAGEGLLATALWLRFLRPPRVGNRLTFEVEPARCAVSLRF